MKRTSLAVGVALLLLATALPALADNPPSSTTTSTASSSQAGRDRAAFAGSVASASSTSLTVNVIWSRKGSASGTVTVGIDPSTKIVFGKGKSSIETGGLVRVIEANGTARRIHVDCNCHFAAGTLDAITTSKIRVQVAKTGPYDTVLNGQNVTFDLGSASVPNLSIGDKVAVVFAASGFFKDPSFDWENATFTVLHLRVGHDKGEASTNP